VVEKIIVLLIPKRNMIGVYFIPTRFLCWTNLENF
jgi:hypothetical protein